MKRDQPTLFDTDPAPWDVDDAGDRLVARVVVPVGPAKPLDYLVPAGLREQLEVGRRVSVPLGGGDRLVTGYCVELEHRKHDGRRLKEIAGLVDRRNLLSPAMLRLTRWMAGRYLCSWMAVLEAVVPAGVRGEAGTRVATLLSTPADLAQRASNEQLTDKQRGVLRYLAAVPRPITARQLALACKVTEAPINLLRKRGLIVSERRRVRQDEFDELPVARERPLVLNAAQQVALDAILAPMHARRHETILLHGVTGSGKTEVYLQAIEEVIRFGRQAIVLVPEISLTPQTKQRFASRFDRVAVLHSHLSDAERHWHWEQIAAGEVQVVVGARSAVFAPTPHLGMIVLDEEHEGSFKQDKAPRYHARDVALQRAAAEGVPLVLGSATPSLESWQRAATGQYRLVELPERVEGRPLPDVVTVDLRQQVSRWQPKGAISRQLELAMRRALDDGGQVILLLNRRGFSTHIQCPACGAVVKCPNCDLALTHHREFERAVCHYCDYETPAPQHCPECRFIGIRYSGQGTQRLESEVKGKFPEFPCLRMDADTMKSPGSHDKALARFRDGEIRILLGTQMIAKGLDFPNVTLVGVVNADVGLHLPDFRAAERTFQLVTQVAGRTGRGPRGGRVLVQTFTPEHPAIQAAARHDYDQFAAYELPIREGLGYPPFTSLVRLVVRGPVQNVAEQFAATLADRIRTAAKGVTSGSPRGGTGGLPTSAESPVDYKLLGPAPAPFAKLRNKYRFHMLVMSPDADRLREAVRQATEDLAPPNDVEWIVDVDALEML
ncbi:MAG: primosomal protein N' [Planctomycetota bacterium]|nr:MAG: primosomal protein N' [Planctomycetota bacterium]